MRLHMLKFSRSVLILATLGGLVWVSAGDLNPPPGAVTPTMKTLADVEPRIAINATNTPGDVPSMYRITQSGSYYLTGNITGMPGRSGIRILTGEVTLDLNGFLLEGAGAESAIVLDSVSNVVIKNGFIANWNVQAITGANSTGLRIENVHIKNIPGVSVFVGAETVIHDSNIENSFSGFQVGPRSRIERCDVRGGSAGTAISVSTGSLVANCLLSGNSGVGISVFGVGSVIKNNVVSGSGSGSIGIVVSGVDSTSNRIENNHVIGGGVGIGITSAENFVSGNTVIGNTDNYNFAAGNKLNILLCEIPESIDWPANVVLAGSLTAAVNSDGLTIRADNVTVDLAGHALIGSAGSTTGQGISVNGRTNVEIKNGTIRNFGGNGISESFPSGLAHRIIDVRTVSNKAIGISLQGSAHLVKGCTAHGNATVGIGLFGSGNRVIGNSAFLNGAEGIIAGSNSLIDKNSAYNNDQLAAGLSNIKSCPNCTFGLNHAP